MKEFERLELVIHRNEKWLEPHEKRGFYLSPTLPLKTFKLPNELDYITESHTPQLRAILKRHWEILIVNLLKELKEKPIRTDQEEKVEAKT